ncbi:unnamed protein product [Colias eurytheme]|nr:unnamed protein product [Colias eurytheme]
MGPDTLPSGGVAGRVRRARSRRAVVGRGRSLRSAVAARRGHDGSAAPGGVSRTAARRSGPPRAARRSGPRTRPAPARPASELISRILDCDEIYDRSWILLSTISRFTLAKIDTIYVFTKQYIDDSRVKWKMLCISLYQAED